MTRTRWMIEGEPSDKEIRSEVMRLMMLSGKGKSICPTEVARSLFHPWRNKVDRVLEVVAQMAVDREVVVMQRDQVVEVEEVSGPVRIQLSEEQ